jgi:glucose/arabinose dehydrogenase
VAEEWDFKLNYTRLDIFGYPYSKHIYFMKQLFIKAKTYLTGAFLVALGLCMTGFIACAGEGNHGGPGGDGGPGDGGKPPVSNKAAGVTLKLPAGFSATVIDSLGRGARHITITPHGVIFVKMDRLQKGGAGIYRLADAGNGKMQSTNFCNFKGTGIVVRNGYLYATTDEEVYRYKLDGKDNVIDPQHPERIVTGLIARNEHEPKAIMLDYDGNLFVNIGAFSNSCQVVDRATGSMGIKPCPVLDSAAGIWEFKADKPDQGYADGIRYATGFRNVVGMDWNTVTHSLFVMQHGRDQLFEIFPKMFTQEQGNELPAECMYELHKGSNGGWPYIYYDGIEHKKILAPEYGGDGKKTGGEDAQDPVASYPAHMAPDGLLFYTGKQFPEKYRNGAFIAFHGSWNRQPEEKGYYVVFQPFKDGKPSGNWEVFADNFAGTQHITSPNRAKYRPCGLAQGPDGSIYVTDDAQGMIWKISYK